MGGGRRLRRAAALVGALILAADPGFAQAQDDGGQWIMPARNDASTR